MWSFEHSVECAADVESAWNFWTEVANWALDTDVETVELYGPFEAGTTGRTMSHRAGAIEWRLADVGKHSAVIEFPLTGAIGRFAWRFERSGKGTRITQHCTIEGERAKVFAVAMGAELEAGIPQGMRKLCEAIERALLR